MLPYSYTSLKVVHDQQIAEALERYRFAGARRMQKRSLLQGVGELLVRFTNSSARKTKVTLPGCEG